MLPISAYSESCIDIVTLNDLCVKTCKRIVHKFIYTTPAD